MREQRSQPNVLLICTDQQRYDSLGCYGATGVHTPNLDRLAAEGIRYDQCYVNNPVCTPSRASLWTGRHLPGHGVYGVHGILSDDQILFPYFLQQAGYDTALLGKLHVSGHLHESVHRHPHDGFRVYEWAPDPDGYGGSIRTAYLDWLKDKHPQVHQRFQEKGANPGHLPVEAHMTTWAADRTIAYLTQGREKDKPFFCCMSVFDPHNPYGNYPLEMRSLIQEHRLPRVLGWGESFEQRPEAHRRDRDGNCLCDPSRLSMETLKEWRVGYHAAIALIDMQVGRVLRALEDLDLARSTIVIFTSDHGDMLGDHGLLAKGCFFYDPCTRVPLIVRVPGGERGIVRRELCQLHDLAGTILELAGIAPAQIRSHMPDARNILTARVLAERGYAACLYRNSSIRKDHRTGQRGYFDPPMLGSMWREGRFKLNIYHEPAPAEPEGELYDMADDPLEQRNLWHRQEHRAVRDGMIERLMRFLVEQDFKGRARGANAMPGAKGVNRSVATA